jgi:hypothetical protein
LLLNSRPRRNSLSSPLPRKRRNRSSPPSRFRPSTAKAKLDSISPISWAVSRRTSLPVNNKECSPSNITNKTSICSNPNLCLPPLRLKHSPLSPLPPPVTPSRTKLPNNPSKPPTKATTASSSNLLTKTITRGSPVKLKVCSSNSRSSHCTADTQASTTTASPKRNSRNPLATMCTRLSSKG